MDLGIENKIWFNTMNFAVLVCALFAGAFADESLERVPRPIGCPGGGHYAGCNRDVEPNEES